MTSFTFVVLAFSLLAASSAAPQNTKYGITIPEACRGKDFCSIRPPGYDEIETKINNLLPANLIAIGSRSGSAPPTEELEDEDNCPSDRKSESVYIKQHPSGTDVDIIVQTSLFPQQLVTVTCKHNYNEKSLKEGASQCFRKLELDKFNLKTSCQESKATRTLLIYDPQENLLKMKDYTISVCCSCQISKNDEKNHNSFRLL